MTATLQHTSWCKEHDLRDEDGAHFCLRTWWSMTNGETDAAVELTTRESEGGRLQIQVWANNDGDVDPDEARRLAAGLIEAADLVEAAGPQLPWWAVRAAKHQLKSEVSEPSWDDVATRAWAIVAEEESADRSA